MMQWYDAKTTVLDTAMEMYEKGLVIGNSGNISMRVRSKGNTGAMAITPTSRHYDTLNADDIPIVDFDGKNIEGKLKPSVETPLHIAIYKARKNVHAIIHTHSTYASAVGLTGKDIPAILLDQVLFLGGEIQASGGALVITPEQIADFIRALGDRSAVLIPNHGAVGTGRTMRDTFTACELIEKTAHVYLLALAAGRVNPLPDEVRKIEKAAYDRLQNEAL
jgi:L-fuculose-phosphate aldolase